MGHRLQKTKNSKTSNTETYLCINRPERRAARRIRFQIFAAGNRLAGILLAVGITDILIILHQTLEIRHTAHSAVLRAENLGARGGSVAVGVVDLALGCDAAHVGDLLEVRVVVACPVGFGLNWEEKKSRKVETRVSQEIQASNMVILFDA